MKNQTDITFILDRSGSMNDIKKDIIGGFNAFLKTQKDSGLDIVCSLVQFDDQYEVVFAGKRAADTEPIDDKVYVPRGSTALHDAMGRTIEETGRRLSALPENDRPNKVVIVVITDGLENSSKEYNKRKVGDMVYTQRTNYSWEFVFIGANQDAILTGKELEVKTSHSLNYVNTSASVMDMFMGGASNTVAYAKSLKRDMSWTADQVNLQAQHKASFDIKNNNK